MLSFRHWLDHRFEKIPDATTLALIVVRSGAAGVSREEMARVLGVPGETVEDMLQGLMASGQVVMMKLNGELRYRMAG